MALAARMREYCLGLECGLFLALLFGILDGLDSHLEHDRPRLLLVGDLEEELVFSFEHLDPLAGLVAKLHADVDFAGGLADRISETEFADLRDVAGSKDLRILVLDGLAGGPIGAGRGNQEG